jgi:stage IV sporulation protein FB
MGWEDRPYYRDRGASSNPLMAMLRASVPMFTIFGIRVRAHVALIIFIASELLLDWTPGYSFSNRVISMGLLWVIVILHEFGHCFAARLVGGSSDEILLWPFGGLTFPDTPQRPWPRFVTTLGGPMVNVILCVLSAWAIFAMTHVQAPYNPLHPIPPSSLTWHMPVFYCWWVFSISYILLLFNLLPIFPLDGGRMVQTVLWKLTDYHRSMLTSTYVGMGGSAALAIFGLWRLDLGLIILAGLLFYACYQEQLILRETDANEPWQIDQPDFAASLQNPPTRRRRVSKRALNRARKRARAEAAERQRLDDILAKVSAQGLASLTWRERRILHKATEQRRKRDLELKSLLED